MRTPRIIIAAVLIAILGLPAIGQMELPPAEDDFILIGRPSPVLAGTKKVSVLVLHTDFGPGKKGHPWPELEQKVIDKLKAAGIDIEPIIYTGRRLRSVGVGCELIICLDTLDIVDSQQCVVRIHTSCVRMVCLENNPKLRIKADVWKSEPAMKIVPAENISGAVTDVVMNDVDAFIHAYVAANPPGGKKAADANTTAKPSAVIRERQAAAPGKTLDVESEFVASRNSDVFHKSDCPSAARISAENRVTYETRDEAIAAGKRPCKRCNP